MILPSDTTTDNTPLQNQSDWPYGKSLFSVPLATLPELIKSYNQPTFRSKQLIEWLYKKHIRSYDEMSNLPKQLREALKRDFPGVVPHEIDKQISRDGTRKYVFEYDDGARVEAVGIPSLEQNTKGKAKHLSVCFSTQAGCAMGCAFCATGQEGLTRNLTAGEMLYQINTVSHDFGLRASHLVSMGQGEPFQNYEAVLEALRFCNAKNGFEIGARHITLSTCGIIQGIKKLAQEPEQFTLAVSLHAARQVVRDELMPRCAHIPLADLKQALQMYVAQTSRRVSLEYIMIRNINDSEQDLAALLSFTQDLLCHINLIPINSVAHSPYQPSLPQTTANWVQQLSAKGKETTVRNSRGADIDGACGQLKNKLK